MFLQEKVYLPLADPRYNILHENGKPVSCYDVFRLKNISDMLDLTEFLLLSGGHGSVF